MIEQKKGQPFPTRK
uniref:Uncharacterized protein n=1 Tax=Arundo donax TaxID=35708 RepID=A0A0A8Y8M5_ARUDO